MLCVKHGNSIVELSRNNAVRARNSGVKVYIRVGCTLVP
jgi:hypothetical protein